MRRKTCIVWNYFTELNAQDALCNVCGRNVRYHRSNTNLRSHLRVWHRKIWCEMTNNGNSESANFQSPNYGSVPNGVGSANEQLTYGPDSSDTIFIDSQDVPNHLNTLPSTDLGFLQQQQQHEQQHHHHHHQQQEHQQQSSTQTKHNLSLKSSPVHSPSQRQLQNHLSMVFPNLPQGIYITQNPEEELSEKERTRDSGIISSPDDCDNMESKEAIAAQIEMMQSSSFANSELIETSPAAIADSCRTGEQVLSNLNLSSLNPAAESQELISSSENKADAETDSIAEYFKICDNNTRQTFLDVMRNDREQHLSAVDKINVELKSVKAELQQTKVDQVRKEQQLEELMKEMNQLQMEMLNLQSRCMELSSQEKNLETKLKTYNKKVHLCDSALNAMSNER